jgi:hypothetical protein
MPDNPREEPVSAGRVLFMVARPRSGTTILGNALGELPGWFHTGELHYLWAEGLPKPRRDCGCRLPVTECPTWHAVAAAAGAVPADGADASTMAASLGLQGATWMTETQQRAMKVRNLMLSPRLGTRLERLRGYVERLDEVYGGIMAATGSRVVVDTSKLPVDALAVARFSRFRPQVLHVTRDPRGAVLSRFKWYAEERDDGTFDLPPARLAYEGALWCAGELSAEVLFRRLGQRRRDLRYEDFVARPADTVRDIAALMGEPEVELPFLDDSVVTLQTNHTVSGNRNRWQVGEVPIALDEQWRVRMNRRDRALATIATAPGLLRYGYHRRRWASQPTR